jgi:hypothetical protein
MPPTHAADLVAALAGILALVLVLERLPPIEQCLTAAASGARGAAGA